MSAPQSYVTTKDANAAVKGREVEILNAIGIPWRAGQRDHIRCPYPDHGGASDWRLLKNGRAICSCTGDHTDSVFDIVGKVEGLDFEASKVRCVGIIGRGDLVRQGNGKGGQSTTAAALLDALAERRDDSLPRAYLAHRLGIEPAAVLMPVTRAVGHRALGYFDPPKTEGGKPKHVGDHPCAVFEQIDYAGEIHAHRIYLAPGGAGKAELGERDPKKSARRISEERTIGRAVIWGDATSAPWCVIAEGIETAAAVAHALRAEIEAGAVYVVAGISASGIEGFRPWPATKRVTVAADQDVSRRGEQAARKFGLRNGGVAVSIALPGSAGFGADWLDIHSASGPEAVRTGILGSTAFVPTADELDEERRRTDGLDELTRVERDYPVPTISGHVLVYRKVEGEIWLCARRMKGDEVTWTPVCTPFGFPERTRLLDGDGTFGLRLAVLGLDGRCRVVEVERESLGRIGGAEIRAKLYALGLRVQGDGERIVVELLKAASPEREVAIVRAPGWHLLDDADEATFVCPGGEVYGSPEGQPLELGVNARMTPRTARGGTLEGWQAALEAAVSVEGCPHWALGVLAGLAGPLVSLCRLDTCGVNVSGITSTGKSTAQRLAASVWSRPLSTVDDSLFQTARATANGTESMAARASGTVLVLDELGHMSGKELGRVIYGLAAGTGKRRMTSDARMRAVQTWSTFVVLSAEKTLREKIQGDGGEWADGMAVRIVDINVTGVNRSVPKETFGRIDGVRKHYGHAGPRFIEALVSSCLNTAEKAEALSQGITRVAEGLAAGGKGVDTRAATPFAIMQVAGELAQTLGILPRALDVRGTIAWAWNQFRGSPDAVALKPEEQVVASIQAWTVRNWGSSIFPTVPDLDRPPNRPALGWYDEDTLYIVKGLLAEAAGGTLSEVQAAKILDDLGYITKRHDRSDKNCRYASYVPVVGNVKVYALPRKVFGRGSAQDDRDDGNPDRTVVLFPKVRP
ncbi:DUF927 domain-containing protein [Heyndrickxia sporothermodurans]